MNTLSQSSDVKGEKVDMMRMSADMMIQSDSGLIFTSKDRPSNEAADKAEADKVPGHAESIATMSY